MPRTAFLAPILLLVSVGACTTVSPVMDGGNGTYLVSAGAAPAAGGPATAQRLAYRAANSYCAAHIAGSHAVILTENLRAQSRLIVGAYGGGTVEAGGDGVRFRCAQGVN